VRQTPLRTALIALGFAGLLAGLGAAVLVITGDQGGEGAATSTIVGVLVGWSFIGVGLFAWDRRPSSRFGAFMTAAGFSWFLGALQSANNPWVFGVGLGVGGLSFGFLTQMLVSFPDGRLRGRSQKGVVGLVWFIVIPLEFLTVPFSPTPNANCVGCPDNPFELTESQSIYDVVTSFELLLAVVALVWLIVVMRAKVRSQPKSQQPIIRGVFLTTAAAIGFVVLSGIAEVAGLTAGTAQDVVNYLAKAALLLVPFAFLFGLLRSRLSAGDAVSDLVMKLGVEQGGPGRVRDALASALSDPSLELAYVLPGPRFVSSDGVPIQLPSDDSGRSASAVTRDGREVAMLIHDSGLNEDPELIDSVGATAALALDNERLDAELRANLAELKASRARLVEAGDAERRRVERDLHDGAQQHLVALALTIRMARDAVAKKPKAAAELLDEAAEQLDNATAELRELARGIHPAVLSDRGLTPALEALAGRSAVPVEMNASLEERLPGPIEAAAYFVVAEALTNTARYAQASKASVQVERENGSVYVLVCDDGVGGADASKGSGLRGLEDRLAALDGTLAVDSDSGHGTTVTAVIPCV
jgi:signal transduction histidine kinase